MGLPEPGLQAVVLEKDLAGRCGQGVGAHSVLDVELLSTAKSAVRGRPRLPEAVQLRRDSLQPCPCALVSPTPWGSPQKPQVPTSWASAGACPFPPPGCQLCFSITQ